MIRAILWDIDNTLLNFHESARVALKRCFEIFSLGECTDEMINEYHAINDRYWNLLEAGEMTKSEILVGRFREFFSNHGLDVSVAEAFNDEYQFRLSDEIVFCDGAPDMLLQLKGIEFLNYIADLYDVSADDRKKRINECLNCRIIKILCSYCDDVRIRAVLAFTE